MPIPSTKPPQRGPYRGTAPKPMLGDYASEAEITNPAQAWQQVDSFNSNILSITQPYAKAAELRAGQAYPAELRRRMADELRGAPHLVSNVRGGRRSEHYGPLPESY